MRRRLLIALPFLASLTVATSAAQAVVVDMSAVGSSQTTVPFNSSARGGYYGVALIPSTRTAPSTTASALSGGGIPYVTSSGRCSDPALAPDLVLPGTGICFHGGSVMHANETFALTWDPMRRYWSGTRGYVEQFLRDVADGSGTLTSPYAVTPQYRDAGGAAGNKSKYGGGCIDYGNPHNSSNANTTCLFGGTVQTGPGYNYPANGCAPTGNSFTYYSSGTNDTCLTDAQLRVEVSKIVAEMGMLGRIQSPGYTPQIALMLPPGVETCLDAAGKLCSVNGSLTPPPPALSTGSTGGTVAAGTYRVEVSYVTAAGESLPSISQAVKTTGETSTITIPSPPAAAGVTGWYAYVTQADGTTYARQQSSPTAIGSSFSLLAPPTGGAAPPSLPLFCSYHSQVNVGGREVRYIVQPWTAMTQCDEPDVPPLPQNPPPDVLARNVGMRLVSPISQAQLASIVNPALNGWFGRDGGEINDNGGCAPAGNGLDKVTVGNSSQSSYLLQREFNNAGVIESDPNTYFGCAPDVLLSPAFVVPSSVSQGDVVEFDGSTTASTLIVPNGSYHWSFGDGSAAVGASVVHTYAKAGDYKVTLTVTDRGANTRGITQPIEVLKANGQPGGKPGGGPPGTKHALHVRLALMPQGLRTVIRHGLLARVTSNQAANGFATLSIPRKAAQRAHISAGHRSSIVIGRGTLSAIKDGSVRLRIRMSSRMARKLRRLRHVTLTLRLSLVGASGGHVAIDAAGHY